MIQIEYVNEEHFCVICQANSKGSHHVELGKTGLTFYSCARCLIDLEFEIVQKCCDTEYSICHNDKLALKDKDK